MGRLDGKVAVITGAGREIGRAEAQLVKEAGGEAMASTDNTMRLEEAERMVVNVTGGQLGA